MQIRDVLEGVCRDARFEPLFTWRGRQAEAPWRLVLVMLLQFAEGFSDRHAAESVRSRIDWKYLLGLDLADAGFNAGLLPHFRAHLSQTAVEQQFLNALLAAYQISRLPNGVRRRGLATNHLLNEVRFVNRLERIAETFRAALRAVSISAPHWISTQTPPDWPIRYGPLARGVAIPSGRVPRRALIETLKADGQYLLAALSKPDSPSGLTDLEVVQQLGRLWAREFSVRDGRTVLRRAPPATLDTDDPHMLTDPSLRGRAGRLRWDLRRSAAPVSVSAQACVPRANIRQRRGTPA